MQYPESFPLMTVEKDGRTHSNHGVKPPSKPDSPEFKDQMQDTIRLCTEVGRGDWSPSVISILGKYNPTKVPSHMIPEVMKEFGSHSWNQICEFVKDDECIEFYPRLIKFLKKKGLKVNDNIQGDFIDDGVAIYTRYLQDLEKTSKKAFDVKYFYAEERPLEILFNQSGVDFSWMANYTHPGHYRYIAQHYNKFATGVESAKREFEVSPHFAELMELIAWVEGMGRSGILVHLPEDNTNGRHISNLTE